MKIFMNIITHTVVSLVLALCFSLTTTIYMQIFEGCNFRGFVVNWPSAKISSSKFHWQTLAVMGPAD